MLNSCQFCKQGNMGPAFPIWGIFGKYDSSEGMPIWSVFLFEHLSALSRVFQVNISYLLFCTFVF